QPLPADALTWLLTTVSDRSGNSYHVTYATSSTSKKQGNRDFLQWTYYPSQITYGDPQDGISVVFQTGDQPDFKDPPRADPVETFRSGVLSRISSTVREIAVWIAGEKVRGYRLDYDFADPSGSGSRTRLSQVSDCAGDGMCKPATHFQYESAGTTYGPVFALD